MSGILLKRALMVALVTSLAVAGCSEPPPARTVTDFLEDPIGLEATLARCNAERGKLRADPECINAREANNRLAAAEQKELQLELELESQRKLDAVRRRSEASAEAGRLAEEAQRRREEMLYEQQFQQVPEGGSADSVMSGPNETEAMPEESPPAATMQPLPSPNEDDTANDSPPDLAAPEASTPTDLNSLREELNRRNQPEELSEPPA